MARSWLHTSWWLSQILFTSPQSSCSPYLAYRMLLLFFCVSFEWSLWIPHQYPCNRGSVPEAVSRSESAMFPLDEPESKNVWSPGLYELPATASSSGSARALMGLKEGLEDSCLCHPDPVLVSGIKSGVYSSPCVELCLLLTSTSGESIQVLFSWQSLKEPLGEQSYLCCEGLSRDSKNGHPMEGVPSKGRSSRRGMAGGGVLGEWVGLHESPGAVSCSGSVTSAVAEAALLCCLVATNA